MIYVLFLSAILADYRLVTPFPNTVCTRGLYACEAARQAIREGWYVLDLPRDTPTSCVPVNWKTEC